MDHYTRARIIGNLLKERRASLRYPLRFYVDAFGISHQHLYEWEDGALNFNDIKKYADALQLDLVVMINGSRVTDLDDKKFKHSVMYALQFRLPALFKKFPSLQIILTPKESS